MLYLIFWRFPIAWDFPIAKHCMEEREYHLGEQWLPYTQFRYCNTCIYVAKMGYPFSDLMRMIEISAKGSQSLILIYPTSVPVIKENDNFTRLCAIQQFFSTKSITVIKRSGQQIHPNHVLNDDALRKLVFPLRTHCRFYQVNKFYNKMKLRLPKPHRGYVEFLPEQEALC